jgi:hypothetical protein
MKVTPSDGVALTTINMSQRYVRLGAKSGARCRSHMVDAWHLSASTIC